jgi:ketosteroid isomerase-like protein
MMLRRLPPLICLGLMLTGSRVALAGETTDKAAITARLDAFAESFNARNTAAACDIFAPSLIATLPGMLEQSRAGLCGNLGRLFARHDVSVRYDRPDIREIILSGNLAVVRLIWTLTAARGADRDSTQESGLDVFQRQANGQWSIIRFATFTMRPNRILD